LAWDTYEFETGCSDSYIPPPCIPAYVPPVCEICHCSDHNNIACPYYISNEDFARLSSMIETMSQQQVEFEIKMREFDLSHETDLRFSAPKLDVCLCDDGASFPALESELEVVLDPSLATLPLVAPSSLSTLRDNTMFNIFLPDPPLPLAQSTEFEVGETFTVNATVDEDDAVMIWTVFLLRCMILLRLLQGCLMWMSLLLCQLVMIWLTIYPLTLLTHSMFLL